MRTFAFAVLAALLAGSAAAAAPASVTVAIGPDLQAKAQKTYGLQEIDRLAGDLREEVEEDLADNPAFEGARVELVLADAAPNKPTMKQLRDQPGLSYFHSIGAGGASIEGQVVRADGSVIPVDYSYYETLRWARTESTWGDASRVFDRFSDHLAAGRRVARH